MEALVIASGGIALALLVVIYWRTAKRYESLQAEVERLRTVQKDMTSDVRARIEEGQKAVVTSRSPCGRAKDREGRSVR